MNLTYNPPCHSNDRALCSSSRSRYALCSPDLSEISMSFAALYRPSKTGGIFTILHPYKTLMPFTSYFFADGCRRLKFLPPDDGHYLADHVFLNLTIGIYTPCHHRCVMESRCVSINIGPPVNDKVVCELSDSDHIQHSQHLKPRRGWSYRGITEVPMTIRFKTYVDKPTTADCIYLAISR